MFYKWILKKVAEAVARYPRTALGLVIGYLVLSVFELIPVMEVVSDFFVILAYVLIRVYIARKRITGQPVA